MTVPVSALQEIAPGAIIELFTLELNTLQHGVTETYRFHAGSSLNSNGQVTWAGNAYLRFPVEADGFQYNGSGQLPRPTLRIANLTGTITALLLTLPSGIEGAKVTRIRTLARYLDAVNFLNLQDLTTESGDILTTQNNDTISGYAVSGVSPYTPDPTAAFPAEVYYIDRKSSETRDVIEFELAAAFDLAGVRAPKRQCLTICPWVYRSTECSYTGSSYFDENDGAVATLALDKCGKRLSSCKARFGDVAALPFGGFPGVGAYTA